MAINVPISAPIAPRTKTLKNGAVYDLDRGRIVDSTNVTTRITSENARELQSMAVAKKRLVMAAAANSRVRPELIAQYGSYAHVAERAETLQLIATTPEAGKAAVMAHQALTADTGMSEKQIQAEAQTRTVNNVLVLPDGAMDVLRDLLNIQLREGENAETEVVDAE